MIYTNGTIEFALKQGGGYDEQRRPLPASHTFSEPQRCNIKERSNNDRLNTEGGKYEGLQFTVLIGMTGDVDMLKKCRISYDVTGEIGEFFITGKTPMKLVDMCRLELSQWQKQ